jgi:hypothetical protein
MILLSVQDSIQFVSKTTDWMQGWGAIVQAIGAIFAIGVIIWGFSQLNKDSKDKQKQIDSLTDLAKEAKEQTKHFSLQVDEMIKGNKLQTEYVRLFQRNVELSDKKRKQEIKPYFHENISTSHDNNDVKMSLIFMGQPAKIIKVESVEDENIIPSFICDNIDNIVIKGHTVIINIHDKISVLNFDDKKLLKIKIVFKDIDGNEYFQLIEGTYLSGMKIHEPIEITE